MTLLKNISKVSAVTLAALLFLNQGTAAFADAPAKSDIAITYNAGHTKQKGGAYANNLQEHDVCLDIADGIKDALNKYSIKNSTANPTATNNYENIMQRVKYAQSLNAFNIEIHNNSASNTDAQGFEIFVDDSTDSQTREFLKKFSASVSSKLGFKDRGIRLDSQSQHKSLAATYSASNSIGILIEVGFLSNKEDASKMNTKEKRHVIGYTLGVTLLNSFGYISDAECDNTISKYKNKKLGSDTKATEDSNKSENNDSSSETEAPDPLTVLDQLTKAAAESESEHLPESVKSEEFAIYSLLRDIDDATAKSDSEYIPKPDNTEEDIIDILDEIDKAASESDSEHAPKGDDDVQDSSDKNTAPEMNNNPNQDNKTEGEDANNNSNKDDANKDNVNNDKVEDNINNSTSDNEQNQKPADTGQTDNAGELSTTETPSNGIDQATNENDNPNSSTVDEPATDTTTDNADTSKDESSNILGFINIDLGKEDVTVSDEPVVTIDPVENPEEYVKAVAQNLHDEYNKKENANSESIINNTSTSSKDESEDDEQNDNDEE